MNTFAYYISILIMKTTKALFLFMLSFSLLVGCQKDDEESTTSPTSNVENSQVRVLLTDAPGDYKAVYIDIQDVQVNSSDTGTSGWVSLDSINKGIYDLLKLTNGLDTLLGKVTLPTGKLSQIRLILGTNNQLQLKNNGFVDLQTPSAQQSGIKIQVHETLLAGVTYDIKLDFDVDKSIVKQGNSGKYLLKPVIRAITSANTGGIKGIALPDSSIIEAISIQGVDSIGAFTGRTGAFLIQGLKTGTYNVFLDPSVSSGLNDTLITNVSVTNGSVTNIGTIQLK